MLEQLYPDKQKKLRGYGVPRMGEWVSDKHYELAKGMGVNFKMPPIKSLPTFPHFLSWELIGKEIEY